jgi:hypothetical protein
MIREEWLDWALDVAEVTSYGVHEVLDCVELLEGRAEEEAIRSLLPAVFVAMGGTGVKARPSDMLRGLLFVSDLVKTAGAVFPALILGVKDGVPAGTRLTDTNSANQSDVDSPDSQDIRRVQEGLDSSESVFSKNELFPERQLGVAINPCDDPPLCAECGRPLIVSPEEPDARGSYNPMAACNYCKHHGRLEDLKRGD